MPGRENFFTSVGKLIVHTDAEDVELEIGWKAIAVKRGSRPRYTF